MKKNVITLLSFLVVMLLLVSSCNESPVRSMGDDQKKVKVVIKNHPDSINFPDHRIPIIYFPSEWYKEGANNPVIVYYTRGERHYKEITLDDVRKNPPDFEKYFPIELPAFSTSDDFNVFFELGNDICRCSKIIRANECVNDEFGVYYKVTSNPSQTDSLIGIHFSNGTYGKIETFDRPTPVKPLKATMTATKINSTQYRIKITDFSYTSDIGIKELKLNFSNDGRDYKYNYSDPNGFIYSVPDLEKGKLWSGTGYLTITDLLSNTEPVTVKMN